MAIHIKLIMNYGKDSITTKTAENQHVRLILRAQMLLRTPVSFNIELQHTEI